MCETEIELLESTDRTRGIAKFIENWGERLYYVACEISDINDASSSIGQERVGTY